MDGRAADVTLQVRRPLRSAGRLLPEVDRASRALTLSPVPQAFTPAPPLPQALILHQLPTP